MLVADTGIEFINFGIKLKDLAKGIYIGDFMIAYYGMIIALGILSGIMIVCFQAKRTGQNVDTYLDFAVYIIVSCIIGARIYYVVFQWDYYKDHISEIINLREGGLAIYGAVIVGVIGAYIYGKVKKVNYALLGDTAIVGLVTGQIIGRWGNFFNREAFGGVAKDSNPFAMRLYFDDYFSIYDVPKAVLDGMEKMTGKTAEVLGYVQVEPTFLYESCCNIIVLAILMFMTKRKKFDGQIVLLYLMGYGTVRFFVEGLRTDQLMMPVLNYPVSRLLSAILVVVSLIVMIIKLMGKSGKNLGNPSTFEKNVGKSTTEE
ncbi:MAG: prolipoprotein diacylglyceryl transferase [Lachnospiraceae bacterium]|nr:prolipoprotein diacylglyceryl transferase [Lachnospiraceae bacterium]